MFWKKPLSWIKKQDKKPISTDLDRKLLKKIRPKILPSWSQFKYTLHFLDKTEKLIIKIALLVLVVTSISWAVYFSMNNRVSVPTTGGEYSEALIGQPKFINPLYASTSDIDSDLTYLIYSGLFRFNEQQKLLPDLASKYTFSEDKKIYDVQLRQDVKWSDGKPFTADDVIFTFEAIQNPIVNSPLITTFQGVKIEKISQYSVRFTLKTAFAPFINSLTTQILPAHIWQDIQPINIKLAKNNLQPVGSGPWKFGKLVKDQTGNIQSYILEPNQYYHKKTPYLKSLTFKFYPDYTQALNALKSQDISALGFLPRNLKDKISNKNFNFYNFRLPQYTAIFFNQEKSSILKDEDLRAALLLATEKTKIAKTLNNTVEITESPILKNSLGYDPKLKSNGFNPVSSTALLDKKWSIIQPEEYFKIEYDKLIKDKKDEIEKIKNDVSSTPKMVSSSVEKIEKTATETVRQKMNSQQSIYRKDKNDNILELKITTLNTEEYKIVAQTVANMWQKAGIKTGIEYIDVHAIKDVLKKRNYSILLYGEIVGNDPDPYPFWHSSQTNYPGLNLARFSNRDADKILEKARSSTSTANRAELYKDFQKIIIKENPAIFLYIPTHTFIVSKDVKGIMLEQAYSPSERYATVNKWYTKTKNKWFGNKK